MTIRSGSTFNTFGINFVNEIGIVTSFKKFAKHFFVEKFQKLSHKLLHE